MTASIVQSNSIEGTTASVNVVLGVAPTVGNTLVAVMSSDTVHTGTPTAGSGRAYTQRYSRVANQGFYVWTRLVASGDSATTNFTPSGANPATLAVIEVQGTYDTVGTGTFVAANGLTAAPTGLTPSTTDGLTLAIAGCHGITTGQPASPSVDNGFTITRTQNPAAIGGARAAVFVAHKVTSSTAATGTTTISWTTAQIFDRDSVQIAFTGISSGALSATATLAATATLTAAGSASTPSGAALAGTATLTATGVVGRSAGAALAATASLAAVGTKSWTSHRVLLASALAAKSLRWLVVGDSISEGQGASVVGNRWIDKANDAIKAGYQPAGVTGAVTGYLPGYYAVTSGWTPYSGRTGSTTEYAANSLGERSVRMASAGSQTYTVTGTSADLLAAAGGTYSWAVDGGSATNVSPGANSKTTISLGAAGSHTITITRVAGTVTFGGVVVYNGDESSGIRVYDAAHYSWMTSDFDADLPAIYNTVAPDLVVIATGINDTQSDAVIKANVQAMIAAVRAACAKEPAIMVAIMYQPNGRSDWTSTAAVLNSIAIDDPTVGIIDFYATMGTATTSGLWTGDGLHPSDSGHAFMATQAATTIAGASAALTATGTLTSAGRVGTGTSATLAATSTLTATGQVGRSSTAALAGTATLTAAGSVSAGLSSAAALAASGTLAAAGLVGSSASSTLSATVTLSATGAVTSQGAGAAALTATATLTAAGRVGATRTAALAAVVTIAAAGTVTDPNAPVFELSVQAVPPAHQVGDVQAAYTVRSVP